MTLICDDGIFFNMIKEPSETVNRLTWLFMYTGAQRKYVSRG